MLEYSDNLKRAYFKLKFKQLHEIPKTSRIRPNLYKNLNKSPHYQGFYGYAMFNLALRAFVMIFIKFRF